MMDLYEDIAEEHAEQTAHLWYLRTLVIGQPHYLLTDIAELDARLSASVDGLRSEASGWAACRRLMADDEPWAAAPLALMALEGADGPALDDLIAVAEAKPPLQPMLESAFGWASPQFLKGIILAWLQSSSALRRRLALACCAMHRVDPGPALPRSMADPDAPLRACALRAAGQLGRQDLLPQCLYALSDDDPECHYRAACAALLLGDGDRSLKVLAALGTAPGPWQERALRRLVKPLTASQSRELLAPLAKRPASLRALIQGVGHTGDVGYCNWLIERMHEPANARLAAEAFTLITGADLAGLELDRPPPDDIEFGPSDDPDDDQVAMDADEDLTWPDAEAVTRWWHQQVGRFVPGARHFMGQVLSPALAAQVLKECYQRQRIAAAQHLCLQFPGTVLFPTDAPGWRQQRLVAAR